MSRISPQDADNCRRLAIGILVLCGAVMFALLNTTTDAIIAENKPLAEVSQEGMSLFFAPIFLALLSFYFAELSGDPKRKNLKDEDGGSKFDMLFGATIFLILAFVLIIYSANKTLFKLGQVVDAL